MLNCSQLKLFIETARGVKEDNWNKKTFLDKKVYLEKHPYSKYLNQDVYNKTPLIHSLNTMKTKKQAIKYIYDNVNYKGIFTDDYWKGVQNLIKDIKKLGCEVITSATNNNIYNNGYNKDMTAKSWNIEVTFNNIDNEELKIIGNIIASGCGSVKDPLDKYDIVLVLG